MKFLLLFICTSIISIHAYCQVWSDEFNDDGIPDSTKWAIVTGDGCPELCGFGNNELQHYSSDSKNVYVKGGYLILVAEKRKLGKSEYASAKLVTEGKGDWKYGTIEVRAKIPGGVGIWPAIWMLPTIKDRNMNWPEDGEIDIMEYVGYRNDTIMGTIHTQSFNGMIGTHKSGETAIPEVVEEFHNYKIEWTSNYIKWYVDGVSYFEYKKTPTSGNNEWPFDKPFHLILNVAVGGNLGGKMGVDDSIWPQKMLIDYVRVYQ